MAIVGVTNEVRQERAFTPGFGPERISVLASIAATNGSELPSQTDSCHRATQAIRRCRVHRRIINSGTSLRFSITAEQASHSLGARGGQNHGFSSRTSRSRAGMTYFFGSMNRQTFSTLHFTIPNGLTVLASAGDRPQQQTLLRADKDQS